MKHRLAVATLTLATIAGSTFGLAPRAFADDSTPLPVAEPVVPSQNSREAVAESAIGKSTVDPATRLVEIKGKGAAAIAKRQATINELTGKISRQTKDCGSNTAMLTEMANSSTSLNTVGVSLAAATDIKVARDLYRSIFIDHRIYLLVAPKAGKVIRCDVQLQRNEALTAEGNKLQATIDEAKAKGVDTTEAQAIKNAAMTQLGGINPGAALPAIMGLLPDKGDRAVQAANTAALRGADAALDGTFASQKSVNAQFAAARKALRLASSVARGAKKAANEQARTARKANK